MSASTTLDVNESAAATPGSARRGPQPALVIVWAVDAPHRVGLVIDWMGEEAVLGRGGEVADGETLAQICAFRPGTRDVRSPLEMGAISRRQLVLTRTREGITVRNIGRCQLRHHGVATTTATVAPGDLLELDKQLLLMCVTRPPALPASRNLAHDDAHTFGGPDLHGVVGESPSCWALREQLAFLGKRRGHVLLLGDSGVGKELCAKALHAHSERRDRALISRNAATLPAGLLDAELFGNVANYPNPGMLERPGLVGEAEGSTLLLDEIGELPVALQAHLLRLLDEGEYQRLGDATPRRADLRVVAATNRAVADLKHDLGARFKMRLHVPGLDKRAEDIPLIARHLLRSIAQTDPDIGARFFDGWDGERGEPRITLPLVHALISHSYTTHVRELERMLWTALTTATGNTIDLTDALRRELDPESPAVAKPELTAETLRVALEKHDGVMERVWRDLGLKNRHVLRRLLVKHGLQPAKRRPGD